MLTVTFLEQDFILLENVKQFILFIFNVCLFIQVNKYN